MLVSLFKESSHSLLAVVGDAGDDVHIRPRLHRFNKCHSVHLIEESL